MRISDWSSGRVLFRSGTATLGALIGAGGYGQPILAGIRLDDIGRILEAAVPAALLALLVQGVLELVERALTPRGLRLAARQNGSNPFSTTGEYRMIQPRPHRIRMADLNISRQPESADKVLPDTQEGSNKHS